MAKFLPITALLTVAVLFVGFTVSTEADAAKPSTMGPITVYSSQTPAGGYLNNKNYGVLSPRAVQLKHQANLSDNGKILLTFEQVIGNDVAKSGRHPTFPIYESDDNGATWKQIADVSETQHKDWGMMNCPQLYELPHRIGNMPKGTIVLAGISTPNDLSNTDLQLMKSQDVGKTWKFESSIATGGENPRNQMGYDPVWEPFLMVHHNKLIVYYSDERDNTVKGSQTIVHETTADGVNWSEPVVDVDFKGIPAKDAQRPGMPIVAQLRNGNFAMTYEHEGGNSFDRSELKVTSDPESPEKWNSNEYGNVVSPYRGSPYIVTLNDGRIAFNNAGSGDVYVFKDQEDLLTGITAAQTFKTQTGAAYNRQMVPLLNGMLLIVNGGGFGQNNSIRVETIDVGDKAERNFKKNRKHRSFLKIKKADHHGLTTSYQLTNGLLSNG
ncbi:glycoside hydrolase [Sporolactobacillus shoreicorticis]|uniref:Sialidase family protein n=1 Tax=Sporolactobacillus shoreicorticis TaxID=1923877 RepID=A0ABW5S0I0_9BACL|nr:sialidase family protein [Sporolactobacillus shoreicorticis]MCO7125163.1 glycoside hydrolase [Sporolactobacillus shoreicorticis]